MRHTTSSANAIRQHTIDTDCCVIFPTTNERVPCDPLVFDRNLVVASFGLAFGLIQDLRAVVQPLLTSIKLPMCNLLAASALLSLPGSE